MVLDFFVQDGQILYIRTLVAAFVVYYVIQKILNNSKYKKYPPAAQAIYVPWFGHMFAFGVGPVDFFMEQYNKLGQVFSFVLFGRDCVFMTGPEAHEEYFNAPESVLCAREAYKFTIPCFGPGVVYDATDEKLQQHRKMASSALKLDCFRIYVPKIEREVKSFLEEHWKEKGELNFEDHISQITILTSTSCLQGAEIRAQVHEGFSKYMHDIDRALSAIGFFYPGLPMPAYRNRDVARRQLGKMYKAILNKRRKEGTRGDDVMQVLMDSKYSDGTPVTDDEICGLLVALMLAGQHTSNITSTWLTIFVLSKPELYKRLVEEQDNVVGDKTELTYEMLKDMKLLNNCIKETLRLRPPIGIIFRKVVQDFKYKEFVIPKDSLVCVSPVVAALTKESGYTDPYNYDPDRFSEERAEDKKTKFSYFPFSSGRHSCIGEKFAYLQVKAVMSIILRKYKLQLQGKLSDYPVDHGSLLASPKGPVRIKYEVRK